MTHSPLTPPQDSDELHRLRLLRDHVPGVVWEWDIGGNTMQFSRQVTELLGYDQFDTPLPRAFWQARLHPEDAAGVEASLDYAIDRGRTSWSASYRLERADHSWAHVHDHAYIERDDSGRAIRVLGLMVDETHQHRIAQELVAAQRLELVGRISRSVLHDLNNLLGASLAYIEMAEMAANAGTVALSDIQSAKESTQTMATLARRLSIFLKPPAPVSRALDLRSIVSGAERLLRVLVRESITLSVQLADQPVHVLGDEHQLEQVLMNVVLNAADAQPNGGTIEIRVFADERRLTPTAQGMAAVIQVVDGGRGIPEHVLPHLFKQPTSSKDASIATGLGLPVSAEILHRMEGHIDVTSERGRGTTVEMVLPLRN